MKDLYIMRHGETLFNVRRKIQGWCDSPLTDNGIKQAKDAGQKLTNIPFDHYYSSTSERCCDTLEYALGHVEYERMKGLKERYFGTYEAESEDLNPPRGQYDTVFPLHGGETTQEVIDRISSTLIEIMNRENHNCVFVVSHAGAIYSFLHYVFHRMPDIHIQNCSIIHFTYDGEFHFVEVL